MKIAHHFSGGAYAKETYIPAGERIPQHSHPHAHLAILAEGVADVTSGDDAPRRFEGPCCIELVAHRAHHVEAVTDVVWFCIWATDDTDPASVDASILKGD